MPNLPRRELTGRLTIPEYNDCQKCPYRIKYHKECCDKSSSEKEGENSE